MNILIINFSEKLKKETVLTQRMTISRKIFGAIQLKTKVTGNSFLSRRNKETE